MEKDGKYNKQRKEFIKLRRRVRSMERQGQAPPEEVKERLIFLDTKLAESGTWYKNYDKS